MGKAAVLPKIQISAPYALPTISTVERAIAMPNAPTPTAHTIPAVKRTESRVVSPKIKVSEIQALPAVSKPERTVVTPTAPTLKDYALSPVKTAKSPVILPKIQLSKSLFSILPIGLRCDMI